MGLSKHARQAKKLLESYRPAFMRLMRAKENIERYRAQLLKSPTLNGIPHGSDTHDMSDYVAELENLISQEREVERTEGEKMRKVRVVVDSLIGIDHTILSYKYIDFMSFTDIAIKLKLTTNAVYIRHNKALERIRL